MQVNHVDDHVTHVVIGGKQSIEFGISQSAEFFQILSSTLYKDQILAVVREVLCNANDAHIEAGVDRPFEITLTQDKFIVKDFGNGIHADDMGLIYGTYGNSTKKNDGKQTGGFGLGCKAPFAYTDHFEVISSNSGIRTIYNLAKSSGQANGKPGITPIVSFPTTETGLQVSIPIKNIQDRVRFLSLINRITRNGDMNVLLNNEPIAKLGFDTSKSNYMVTKEDGILDTQSVIMIRYGNVIYPVDSVAQINGNYGIIDKHLSSLISRNDYYGQRYRIVFQAPPHSISVTPSRESLSMQDHTINTLNKLFEDFIALINVKFKAVCTKYAVNSVVEAIQEKNYSELLSTTDSLPTPKSKQISNIERMFDMETMANRYMQLHYPDTVEFRKEDITRRLTLMAKDGMLNRGLVQTYLREMKDINDKVYRLRNSKKTTWLQKQVLAPLAVKAISAGLDRTRLYTYDQYILNAPGYGKPPLVLATNADPHHLFQTLPYLRNIVVISASLKDIWERAKRHQVFQDRGEYEGFIFYHATMKKDEKERAVAFFKSTGMEVVDLTFRQEWEAEPEKPVASIVRKPPKVGVVSLASVVKEKHFHTRYATDEHAARIQAPEFMVKLSFNNDANPYSLPSWDNKCSRIIVDLFGDKGGITNNTATFDKWIEKGAKMFKQYIDEKMLQYIINSSTIKEYWAFNPERVVDKAGYNDALLRIIYSSEVTRKEFNLVNNLTDEDKLYLQLWKYTENDIRYDHQWNNDRNKTVKEIRDYLAVIPMDPINDVLLAKFVDNPLLGLISGSGVYSIINKDSNSPSAKKALEILITALNQ